MNSISRYHLDSADWSATTLVLEGAEAHHCTRVMRTKEGDTVEIFDGTGKASLGTVSSLAKERVEVTLQGEITSSPRAAQIHLKQAIPKGGNMELIVQKAVELGVSSIQPLVTENTVARAEQMEKKRQKWQRIALEACKQCGQNWLPEILPPLTFTDWISTNEASDLNIVAALHPTSIPAHQLFGALSEKPSSISLLIGPEGDFSDSEYEQIIGSGFQPISLGEIVLRVETATLYCISIIQHELSRDASV